ncbi:MAG: methionyl-tRNA formyltransferase, partial [Bacteroidota bacterium]
PSPVKVYAQEQGLTILQPEKLRNPDFIAALTSLQPDLAVVVAFRMLPKMVWSIPPQGTLNLHAALLPDYRGAAPLNWVIINGETKTGATTFLIDKKIDTGAMLLQTELDIPPEWNAGDLHDAMMETGADLVLQTVQAIDQGTVTPQAQDHTGFVHPAPKIFKENCRINWDQDVETIHNFVRGLSPYPTAWTRLNDKLLKIFAGRPNYNSEDSDPGALRVEDNRLFVAVRKAWWEVLELQLEGKKRMDTGTFLRGYKEELQHVE